MSLNQLAFGYRINVLSTSIITDKREVGDKMGKEVKREKERKKGKR